jgi:PKD domain
VSHRFPDNGTYFARVVVDDRHGGVDTATHRIVVANVAPTGVLSAPGLVNEGEAIALTLSNLADPSSVDVAAGLLAAFSCDGLSYGPFATAPTGSCPALDDGARAFGAKVRDKDQGTSTYTRSVLVTNVPPSVDAGVDRAVVSGETISLAGRFSDPGAADAPWSWGWSSGQSGSATSQGELLAGSYRACSAATLSLTVRDKDGGTGTDAMTIAVTPFEVGVDVRSQPLSLKGGGSLVTVYVLSAVSFNAASLDPATVRLTNGTGAGTMIDRRSDGTWNWSADRDLSGDGRIDASLRFRRDDLVRNGDLTATTTQLTLTGVAGGCVNVRGTDPVIVR